MASRSSDPDEAVKFYNSLKGDFDTSRALRWHYMLSEVKEESVEPVMRSLQEIGFSEVEPESDEEDDGLFLIWFAEKRKHTAKSFATRVKELQAFAEIHGLVLADWSAGTN